MKKIKKVFMSFAVFVTSFISKTSAADIVEIKYGVFEPEPTMGEKILNIGKFAIPVILFIIGLFVIISKKITKKVKVIVTSVLVILAIISVILMNYIATNF